MPTAAPPPRPWGYYDAALAPVWPRIRSLVDAERAALGRAQLDRGVDGLLDSLRPVLRWSPPVLEADYPVDRDLHLAGRGLLLVPSVFCWRTPVTLVDAELRPVLVYPIAPGPDWWSDLDDRSPKALARLLGPSRAAALRVVEDGCTSGELARRIGVTAPTASQHAAVLREAKPDRHHPPPQHGGPHPDTPRHRAAHGRPLNDGARQTRDGDER
ncbi:ArsR/SmtB family transcription factor [Streptomyces cavernae]|uniref:ArsR/SmtB family transcription factor n=1 Tax=Streptomyces cavernae TaxID=2259034 RepID=UPI000FEC1300|nr:winged helix-turn-helix domain-containing protein [Streptomyces cavernae]